MSDINQCTFTGRLGADPEIKSFQNGGRIANMRLAVGSQWKDRNTGERKERTEWVSLVAGQDGLVGVIERYLRKGSQIAVVGEFRTRKWQDQSGADRYSTEVHIDKLTMLGDAKGAGSDTGAQQQANYQSSGFADDLDQDVPFASADMRFEGRVF
jgi:single-strand DNA-binding protein